MSVRITIFLILFNLGLHAKIKVTSPNQQHAKAFAVVIDALTYSKTEAAVKQYAGAVEVDGLSVYILRIANADPSEIRAELQALHRASPPIEGAVFIGDIPIPMIRDAQHLTSAFKIDQNSKRYSWQRTSVPSDRFYDDFNLKFNYLKQDTANVLLYYYSLSADSPQKIHSDIYTARIKAPVADDSKYEKISSWLVKAAAQKKEKRSIKQAFVFNGHGYHSESLDAWASSVNRYREQFPNLFDRRGRLQTYYHEMSYNLKFTLLKELQDPKLDMAVFHAHGADDTQYLLGFEPASSIAQNKESMQLFLRSKLRSAKRRKKSVAETQLDYMSRYDIPLSWFEDTFSDSLILADSLLYASQDIHTEDIENLHVQARLVIFDECYNGAFIQTPYMAGSYLFGPGKTIAAVANSVNVRQDIWADEYFGLLNNGWRTGQWHQMRNSLESHLFGDPTFRFVAHKGNLNAWNLFYNSSNERNLRALLTGSDVPLKVYAIARLAQLKGASLQKKLVDIYRKDSSINVRLEALKQLAAERSDVFADILVESINDPAELIRRFTVIWMGDIGREAYLPYLAAARIYDVSDRVRFDASGAMDKINPAKTAEYYQPEIDKLPESEYRSNLGEHIAASQKRTLSWLNDDLLDRVSKKNHPLKKRLAAVRTFRNYRFHQAVPVLIKVLQDEKEDTALRLALAEALGWFSFSYQRPDIIKACDQILNHKGAVPELHEKILMTRNRLVQGLNNPVAP